MPAASEQPAPLPVRLPHTFRPLGVRMVALVLGVLLLLICAVGWFSLPPGAQAQFNPAEKLTLLTFGIALYAAGYALFRCRVVARPSGVMVVNGYRARRFHWNEVLAVSLRRGSPWAVLDLSDGTSVAAMGIQSADGDRAVSQVRQLRGLIEAMTRPE